MAGEGSMPEDGFEPGSSRMCAPPPPACRSTCDSSRAARCAKAACHLSLAGHRRLPAPGCAARAGPCPILGRQAKITRRRG